MRIMLAILAAASVLPVNAPQTQLSHTTENLRGVSAVSRQIAWASGAHGTYLRTTDGGHTWTPAQVPDAAALDFRGVVAFSADEAFLMSSGPGDQSRIYHTGDAGQHWQLQYSASDPKSFFDSMVFWDRTHGIVLGDPIPDETGQLKFQLLITADGQSWTPIPPAQLPPALEGEAAFAASNSCIAIPHKLVIPSAARDLGLPNATKAADTSAAPSAQSSEGGASAPREPRFIITMDPGFFRELPIPDPNIFFATGGRVARVFHSSDLGHTWQVVDAPITHGSDSSGIFSIAFRDSLHGVIVGGDYKHPDQDGPNLAFTSDGGKTWKLSEIHPQAYFSAVAYDRRNSASALVGKAEKNDLDDNQANPRIFIVGPKFIFDFRPPQDPTRISPRKKSGIQFNAISPYPEGGVLLVGPGGSIAIVP
jgi:photosystem II stability/assembly factor-like uncharacterized protein